MTRSIPVAVAHSDIPMMSRETVLGFLNAALATELRSLVRCKSHYYSTEHSADGLREEFLDQVVEESMITDRLVERILELGGRPDFGAQRGGESVAPEEIAGPQRREVIAEDLDAQKRAIENYRDVVRLIGTSDAATCRVLEDIIHRDQRYVERLARHLNASA